MPHISLVTLGVDDLARSTAFYEALGWRRSTASVADTVTFLHGTPVLALYGRDALAGDALLERSAPQQAASVALAMNVATEGDVDDVIATAEQEGAVVCKPPERASWGGYSGYFLDPDDHLWEVAHNPYFALQSDGRVRLPDGE